MNQPSPACKPAHIANTDVEAMARQGVARALAARQAMMEMTPEEAAAVGGGLTLALAKPIIYGGLFTKLDVMNLGGLSSPIGF
ncbi:MAG: hypothetical protein JNM61_08470 [Zoogloeaceae bacterium]|nr:hypothetical protein [Zoogloeaceae bacterium]